MPHNTCPLAWTGGGGRIGAGGTMTAELGAVTGVAHPASAA
jgi:hypothetical protein